MSPKDIVKGITPPIVLNALRRITNSLGRDTVRFTGNFASWEEADRASTGYANPIVLERTRSALLKVKNHEAAFERDSVLFDRIDYPFPLMAGLLRAAAEKGSSSSLSVLDFGGSLGTTYFQCRSFLPSLRSLRWSIVEQPAHVTCGRSDFENDELHFYESIEDCLRVESPNVLLLSSVVQYLPKPYSFLAEVVRQGFENIIIDRTPFLSRGFDRLTIQRVPDWIYPAVYPCWFLSEHRFLEQFNGQYDLLTSFPALDTLQPDGDEAYFKGYIFKRTNRP